MNTSRFEDRLLIELKQVVRNRPAGATPEPPPRMIRPAWRPRLALAGAAAALAIAGAVLLPMIGGQESTAYAVTVNDDGTVTVKINHFSDAEGLRAKLADVGIPATVEYLPLGQMCKEPWFTGDSNAGSRLAAPANDGSITFTLNRGEFTGDKSLVVQTSGPKKGIENGTEIMSRSPPAKSVSVSRWTPVTGVNGWNWARAASCRTARYRKTTSGQAGEVDRTSETAGRVQRSGVRSPRCA